MKLLVISTPIFKTPVAGYAGLEVIAYEQAKGLAARGHEVTLVAPDGSECEGCTIIGMGPAGHVDEKGAWSGYPEHKTEDGKAVLRRAHQGYWQALPAHEVVIDHSWQKWSYSLKAEGVFKGPILGWFHAPVNTMYQVWPPNYPGHPPVDKACPVCISEDQAQHFKQIYNREAKVCYNGIDPEVYKPIPGVKRTDRFLFLARYSTIKGADIALEVCYRAGVGLDVVGDTIITNEPGFYEHCRQLAERTSPGWDVATRGKQFRIQGGCSRGETVGWYSRAHAFLHPNERFREPLGLAPLEAQACGLPVIAWNYGAMRETVVNNVTGWLVNSQEWMVGAIHAAMQTQGEGPLVPITEHARGLCRANALRFTVDRMVQRVEKLCQEALEGGGW